jgi:hypothetical protein
MLSFENVHIAILRISKRDFPTHITINYIDISSKDKKIKIKIKNRLFHQIPAAKWMNQLHGLVSPSPLWMNQSPNF